MLTGDPIILDSLMSSCAGKIVNLRHLDEVISSINSWYGERGLFGRVCSLSMFFYNFVRYFKFKVRLFLPCRD